MMHGINPNLIESHEEERKRIRANEHAKALILAEKDDARASAMNPNTFYNTEFPGTRLPP